jgi:ABC transport system ATP-binding/permease protein
LRKGGTSQGGLGAKRQQLELPDVVSNPARLTQAAAEIELAEEEVDTLYARWAELEAKRA